MSDLVTRRRGRVGPVLWRLVLVGPLTDNAYRGQWVTEIVQLLARIYLFTVLWSAVLADSGPNAVISREQAVAYSTLAALMEFRRLNQLDTIAHRVQDGSVVQLYLRPFSGEVFAHLQGIAHVLYGMLWLVVGGAVFWLVGTVSTPSSPGLLALCTASFLLAGLVNHLLFFLVDLSSVLTKQNVGLVILYGFVSQLLSGALIPLWLFPGWFQQVASLLPFQAAANLPLSLYVGRLPADDYSVLLVQAGWCVALLAAGHVLWRQAGRRLTVQGG